jgi:hypothetical protein
MNRMTWACLALLTSTCLGYASELSAAGFESAPPEAMVSELKLSMKLADVPKVGENTFLLRVADGEGKPVLGARVSLSAGMTNMDMGTTHPKVTDNGDGSYTAKVMFSMAGPWRVTAKVEADGRKSITSSFDFKPRAEGEMGGMDMAMGSMKGRLGDWGMQREGSGTSWLPDSSPMFMKALPKFGRYEINLMGAFSLNTTQTSGPRGTSRFYSNSMPMLMVRRETGGGILGFNVMISLDAIFNGEYGYPDLFQTGETAYGNKLTDYQHPHDLIDEVTVSYAHPVGRGVSAFLYGGPAGEPALGGPTFMHRPSGMDVPEAPISHHWFDSTHISYGVLTAGLNTDKWQIEGSLFNGHEPDENRYAPDPVQLNSASGRVTFNPTKNLSFNTSYGYLSSPESTEPGVDQHRITAAAIWNLPLGKDNLAFTGAFGRNLISGTNSDAFLLEGTYMRGSLSMFARFERVDKNELVGVPAGSYKINKLLFGGVRELKSCAGFDFGLGAYAGVYSFPSSLEPFYGKSPFTFGVFLRVRPGKM